MGRTEGRGGQLFVVSTRQPSCSIFDDRDQDVVPATHPSVGGSPLGAENDEAGASSVLAEAEVVLSSGPSFQSVNSSNAGGARITTFTNTGSHGQLAATFGGGATVDGPRGIQVMAIQRVAACTPSATHGNAR